MVKYTITPYSNSYVTMTFKGLPVAKERARKGRNGFYTPQKTRAWERFAKSVAVAAMSKIERFNGALYVGVMIKLPVPSSWPEWKKRYAIKGLIAHTKKPDTDNILKAVKDALNEVAYKDDSYVVKVEVEKIFSHEPGIDVQLGRIEGIAPCQVKSKKEAAAYLEATK